MLQKKKRTREREAETSIDREREREKRKLRSFKASESPCIEEDLRIIYSVLFFKPKPP